jgi:rubrerythrin
MIKVKKNSEKLIESAKFHIHKFGKKEKPAKEDIVLITCFSEFGCESLGLHYCIPQIIIENPDKYYICVGWYGRQFLYSHLVDEYWEMDETHQFLREYVNAFNHKSKNLKKIENNLSEFGKVIPAAYMARISIGNFCKDCGHLWSNVEQIPSCPKCDSINFTKSLLSDCKNKKKDLIPIPKPSQEKMEYVKKYLKPKTVGIFARNRKMYGRNLDSNFYLEAINLLKNKGYNIIWLGEKCSVLPCPDQEIVDFSQNPESQDLELTLAIISQLEFTVQFWTASTRLASMVNVPWLLFESPDQLIGGGQEGIRIRLTSDEDKRKLVFADFLNVKENPENNIKILRKAIEEMEDKNWKPMIGDVKNIQVVEIMLKNKNWI